MKKNLTEVAYDELRAMILSNRLQVGKYYLEQALADSIQVSRTPLREACVKLVQEGLVTIVPRKGIFIKPLSIYDLKEIYDVIAGLELQAIRGLRQEHCQGSVWDCLCLHIEGLNRALNEANKVAWLEHDTGFHNALIRLSGNATLAHIAQQQLDKSQRIRLLTLKARPIPEASTREHTATFEAIKVGDFKLALDIHDRHRVRSSQELIDLLTGITGLIENNSSK